MKSAKSLFTALLAVIIMAQPVFACCLVHVELQQHDAAADAPPCHGHSEPSKAAHPEPDTCSKLGDCALASINHQNAELKTEPGPAHPDNSGDFTVHQGFWTLFPPCPIFADIDPVVDESFVHLTPVSLNERLLI